MAGLVLAWEVVALAAASTPPALSESSESHVRSCRATRDPTRSAGLAVAGRWLSYPSHIRVERAATRGAASSVVRVTPDDLPMSRHGPSRWPVGPVLLEPWWRGLFGPRSGRPLRPSGAAGLRARLSATRVGGGVAIFKFVVALVPSRFVLASSACWPSVGSARDGAVCRAAPLPALPGPLAGCPGRVAAWTMLAEPVVGTLGGSRAASRADR